MNVVEKLPPFNNKKHFLDAYYFWPVIYEKLRRSYSVSLSRYCI